MERQCFPFTCLATDVDSQTAARPVGQRVEMTGGVRRTRNIRSRIAAAQRARQAPTQQETAVEEEGGEVESNSSEEEDEGLKAFSGKKVGTKKLRRLQEKAEKKAMREVGYLSVLLDCTVISIGFLFVLV